VRFAGWLCLVLGVVGLCAATGLGIVAIQQATEISAYNHARPCPAGEAPNADCLRTVDGSVVAVTEYPGADRIPADYALDVRTASGTLHLRFNADSPMLSYAVDGDPAVVTMWRGRSVTVSTDGRSAVTTSVPETALAHDLGNGEEAGGIGVFFVLGALAIRRNRKAGGMQPVTSPVVAAATMALFLGGIIVTFSGFALGGKPSRLGPDLTATGAALAVVLGLSVWLRLIAKRLVKQSLARRPPASRTWVHDVASATRDLHAPVLAGAAAVTRRRRTQLRAHMHPASVARMLGTAAAVWLAPALTVAVLFGVFFTGHDGPASRAYRQAPACVGETNLNTCAGNFTAVINGVRSPANAANGADISYVTQDGGINTWASFGGNSAADTRLALADEHAHALLTIRVWRGSIVGADFGGSWHWTWGNPPGNTIPTIFLAVGFALLLLLVRLGIHHRRARSTAITRRLLVDDLGQVVAAACSVVLLAYGFWPGAVLALATLVWLALSARQAERRRRRHSAQQHAS